MTSRHANPAIYAGLTGAAAWAVPTYAQALTVFGHEVPTSDPTLAFVAGCVVGAVVAGGASVAVSHAVARRAAHEEVASAMASAHSRRRSAARDDADDAPYAPVRDDAPRAAAERRTPAQDWEQTGNIRVQSVSGTDPQAAQDAIDDAWNAWEAGAKRSSDYVDVAEGYVRTRTFAERMSARARGVASVLSERLGASRMEGLPVIARADGSVGDVGESWWDDALGSDVRTVASATYGGESVSDTMAGNSAVLFTAQTPEEMRAAQEVWQSQSQQQSPYAAETQANAYGQAQPAAGSWPAAEPQAAAGQAQPSAPSEPVSAPADAPAAQGPAAGRPMRSDIASRLADPAEAFPEKKRYTDEQQDLWAVALAALDERYEEQIAMGPEPAPVTDDDADALDEPEGLEPDTAFIPFKPQAGHPEVVDTDSYVDMLVDQELARNESASVRKLAHHKIRDYFKVIDGTGDLKGARHLTAQQA